MRLLWTTRIVAYPCLVVDHYPRPPRSLSHLRHSISPKMDDAMVEDEKKPFDAEHAGHDDDAQPDPDENLMMESGNGRVWLVKVYKQVDL